MPRQESQAEVICILCGSDLELRIGLAAPNALPQAQGAGREQPMRESGAVVPPDHPIFDRSVNVVSGVNEQIRARSSEKADVMCGVSELHRRNCAN
jgi:hypothetical protein